MLTKLIRVFVLAFLMFIMKSDPAAAALSQGDFTPCIRIQDIFNDKQVQPYRIQAGDTLWNISRTYNVDIDTVMVMNKLDSKSTLKVGQVVKIPCTVARMHSINKGETMWDIARKYDVNINKLIEANPRCNPARLKIGDNLIIPDKDQRIAIKNPSRSFSLPSGIFSWPVIGTITSNYGWRKSGFHHGLDIAADNGTPIRACESGKVSFTGNKPVYGRTVIIDHPDGYQSIYAHTNKIYVRSGQKIVKGQIIATIGITGRTTGPHLHLEIKKDGKNDDPLKYLKR